MKLLEFGDTVFIVLRKQPLIFGWFSYVETLESSIRHRERFHTFLHVLLLRFKSNAIQSAEMDCHDLDYAADSTNNFGNSYNCFDILLCTNCSTSMQRYDIQLEIFCSDVY